MKEEKKVPTLRFPEFSGNWASLMFKSLYPKIRNGFVGTATPYYREEGIPYVQGKNVKNGQINDNGLIYICKEFHEKNKNSQLRENDIVMVQSGHVGDCALITQEHEGNNCHAVLVMTPLENVYSKFYVYFFYAETGKHLIHRITTGNTIRHILSSDIKTLNVFNPIVEEQQKIASFLTQIDTKIEQLTKKQLLLQDYKKGVMQKIFSQEIRFKQDDGSDYPDWETKKIGSFTIVSTGGTPSTLKKEFWDNGNVRWMNSGELNLKKVFDVKGRITTDALNNSSTKLIPMYSILIGLAGQGKTRGTVAMNMVDLCVNQSIAAIYPKKEVFDEEFLYQNLNNRYEEIRRLSTGDGGRGGLNLQIIKSIKVPVPSVSEQTKISTFLSDIDNKISHVEKQIEGSKQYKQALLQQMFV